MDSDAILVIGLFLGVLAIPALLNSFSEGAPPRSAAILVMIASVLIVVALYQKPSGYRIADIPGVIVKVIGRVIN
ncbi:MAG: hypothetical protein Q7J57_13955 [Gemmobacter sp.]|nr:hypothetical protein [Gemmobacter sp.]